MITGQFTIQCNPCNENVTVGGYLGISSAVFVYPPYTASLTDTAPTATISMSQILSYGGGTYPISMDASYYLSGGGDGDVVQALNGSVNVVQLN